MGDRAKRSGSVGTELQSSSRLEIVVVIETSFPVVELPENERQLNAKVYRDSSHTTIAPFFGADFDWAPSI